MNAILLDAAEFLRDRKRLEYPASGAIEDAYRSLGKRGVLEVFCDWGQGAVVIRRLEECGGFAVEMQILPGFEQVWIRAWKGKAGPCYETGRSAAYLGAAAGAMDDDRHLIVGSIRVCEKTAGLYTLPPYQGLLAVSAGDPRMLDRLDSDPIPFSCDTLDEEARRLAGRDFSAAAPGAGLEPVVYPGPFKWLVLRNGAMLRRGQCALIPAGLAADLAVKDHLAVVPCEKAGDAVEATRYPQAFAARGAGCFLEEIGWDSPGRERKPGGLQGAATGKGATPDGAKAGAMLDEIPEALRQRLRRMIEQRETYFLLTGSDPRDAAGCCPNDLVGAANQLVAEGVLSRHQIPTPPDGCSSVLYALADEIQEVGGGPQFTTNVALRRLVAAWLDAGQMLLT